MGLPVLTLQGQSFASRVASSILTALDLPELITQSMASYEARALELAKDVAQLQALRSKLANNKTTSNYFNQTQYVRGLEVHFKVLAQQDAPPAPTRNSCLAHRVRQTLAPQIQVLRALWEKACKVWSRTH